MSRSAGPGSPISFVCPVARRNREGVWGNGNVPPLPKGHEKIVRTGRTKPYRSSSYSALGVRSMSTAHEYLCECGHRGWSAHKDILFYPISCPDGGTCHHECQKLDKVCFRVVCCEPLSGVFPKDEWPKAYRAMVS